MKKCEITFKENDLPEYNTTRGPEAQVFQLEPDAQSTSLRKLSAPGFASFCVIGVDFHGQAPFSSA